MKSKVIRIFFVDGTPTGIRTAEIGLSTCTAVMCQRGDLRRLAERPESRKSGLYVLLGEDPQRPGTQAVYVGEGDVVIERLSEHDRSADKTFWERAIVFTAKDQNVTKAHWRYLESALINTAKQAKLATVTNRTEPPRYPLSEADLAEMDEMRAQISLLLGALGVPLFEAVRSKPSGSEYERDLEQMSFRLRGEGFEAECRITNGQYVVLEGSTARARETASLTKSSAAKRASLRDKGVLVLDGSSLRFSQDYAFGSPSGAAEVVCGKSMNGRTAWKLPDGRTLADVQDGSSDLSGTRSGAA
jgi:hypothetical protein